MKIFLIQIEPLEEVDYEAYKLRMKEPENTDHEYNNFKAEYLEERANLDAAKKIVLEGKKAKEEMIKKNLGNKPSPN